MGGRQGPPPNAIARRPSPSPRLTSPLAAPLALLSRLGPRRPALGLAARRSAVASLLAARRSLLASPLSLPSPRLAALASPLIALPPVAPLSVRSLRRFRLFAPLAAVLSLRDRSSHRSRFTSLLSLRSRIASPLCRGALAELPLVAPPWLPLRLRPRFDSRFDSPLAAPLPRSLSTLAALLWPRCFAALSSPPAPALGARLPPGFRRRSPRPVLATPRSAACSRGPAGLPPGRPWLRSLNQCPAVSLCPGRDNPCLLLWLVQLDVAFPRLSV